MSPRADTERRPDDHDFVDVLIKGGAIHQMTEVMAIVRSLAIRGDSILAVAADRSGLDHLITKGTTIIDDPADKTQRARAISG